MTVSRLVSGAVICALTSAQTPAPPIVRVTTRLVQINVIAVDKKGKPVADLTKDDFIVRDEGEEQKISLFSLETTLRNTGAAARANVPAGALTFSNRVERTTRGATAILFDGLNTRFQDQAYAKEQHGSGRRGTARRRYGRRSDGRISQQEQSNDRRLREH